MTTPLFPKGCQEPKLLGCFCLSHFWNLTCDNKSLPEEQNFQSLCITWLSPPPCVFLGPHMKTCPAENEKPGLGKHFSQSDVDFSQTHLLSTYSVQGVVLGSEDTQTLYSDKSHLGSDSSIYQLSAARGQLDRPLSLRFSKSKTAVRFPWDQTFKVFSLAEYQCFINGAVMMLVTHPQRAQSLPTETFFLVCSLNFFTFSWSG